MVSLQLTDGGKAAKGGIAVGDMVLSIDGIATEGMKRKETALFYDGTLLTILLI